MTNLNFTSTHRPEFQRARAGPLQCHARLRVICATDLWGRSDQALQKALWLAEAADAELLLLHVVDGETPLRIAGRRADHARGALEWRVRRRPGLKSRPAISVRVGNPHRTITQVARQWRADLVVIGPTRPHIADRILATTAERLALGASCAVLVVNRDEPGAYSQATVVAKSCGHAAAIEHLIRGLQILARDSTVQKVHPSAPAHRACGSNVPARERIRAWKERSRTTIDLRTATTALIDTPPDLLVAMVDRWPVLFGLSRRNAASQIARCTTTDVLIAPHLETCPDAAASCRPQLRVVR